MYKNLALLLCLATAGVQAKDFERPIANPGETTFAEDWHDFFGLEGYGYEEPSKETIAFIKAIMNDMKMNTFEISFRKMSRNLVVSGMRENAFVVQLMSPSMARIYISEEWFQELSHEEKVFLVRHELTHLKKGHVIQKMWVEGATALAFAAGLYGLVFAVIPRLTHDRTADAQLLAKAAACYVAMASGMVLVNSWFSRVCEREADAGAAADLVGAQGGKKLFENWLNKRDPQSRFVIKRMLSQLGEKITFFAPWFSTHPELKERYAYCEQQCEKLAAQQA